MLKASGPGLVVFGLSDKNLELLKQGNPIHVDLNELGMKGQCLIFHGQTNEHLKRAISELIGPKTVIKDTTGDHRD